ncbi:hypothetical protein [Arthrobacter sp. CAN_A1]|uniref:hypothetical protein n=1 Tax=Arthrobacter sp. CAN_A1 TaxID=2787717 RepID=UPI0018C98259
MTISVVPRRRSGIDAIHAELVPSACIDDELSTQARRDPYWDRLWAPGSQAAWIDSQTARHHWKYKLGRVNQRKVIDEAEAIRYLTSNRGRAPRQALWGVLDSWHTVSAEQAAALTGYRLLLDPNFSQVSASFAMNVLDIGAYTSPSMMAPGLTRSSLYRPSNSTVFECQIKDTLTWPEWVSITGGYPWSAGGQYDRHNLLAVELALRAAEYLPVGAIMGEKFSNVDLLAGSGLGKKLKKPDNRRADGTIVREDGMRIAYELTASATRGFENKVRRWAQLISENPLETSGLTVVFVAAPHPNLGLGSHADPRPEIYRRLAKVLREFPGSGKDSPAARIGVTSWDEWFPARHEMSEAFFRLSADFAIKNGKGSERWVPRSLLDMDFVPWHTFDATALVDNSKLLTATPHWLRKGEHTHLIGTPMDRAGVQVPHPAPVRPELVKGRPLGAGVGVAGDTQPPARLQIIG